MESENQISEVKPTSFRIPEPLLEELRELVHQRRTTRTEAVIQGLKLWMGSQSAVNAPAPQAKQTAHSYPRHREIHDMLEFILQNDKKAADWIIGNLRMFEEALRLRAASSVGPPGTRKAGQGVPCVVPRAPARRLRRCRSGARVLPWRASRTLADARWCYRSACPIR